MIESQVSGGEAIHLVVGLVLGEEEIDLWGKMNASSVDAQGIGHETVLQPEVDVVGVEVHFHHVLDLMVIVVGIVLEEIVTGMSMTVMMEGEMGGATVIEIVLTVGMTSMEVETAILTTGTHLLEIVLQVVIGMMLVIDILKMATSKTEVATIGILVPGVAVIGMVLEEVLAVTREEVTEIGQALTTAQAGEDDRLPTSAIKNSDVRTVRSLFTIAYHSTNL